MLIRINVLAPRGKVLYCFILLVIESTKRNTILILTPNKILPVWYIYISTFSIHWMGSLHNPLLEPPLRAGTLTLILVWKEDQTSTHEPLSPFIAPGDSHPCRPRGSDLTVTGRVDDAVIYMHRVCTTDLSGVVCAGSEYTWAKSTSGYQIDPFNV
jgi:hypothetical protein